MGVVTRNDSKYYWLNLERPGQRVIRESTRIPVHAATPQQQKENRALAENLYAARMGDLARSRHDLPNPAKVRTFAQQAAWYETHHTAKHRGALQERRKLARLRQHFDTYALEDMTPARWAEYETARRTDGVQITTIGRELAIAKAILNTAVGDHIKYNPLAHVRRQNPKRRAKRTITKAEDAAFRKALSTVDPELHDLYVVGVGTLLRQENLIYLQRGAYRRDRLVVDTKTGPHQVPLTGPTVLQRRAAKVLRVRLPKEPNGYFFPYWRARFAEYEDPGHPGVLLRKKVQRAAKAVGIPWGLKEDGIVWHTATRATGATRLLREFQVDVRTVQMIGGWSSLDQMADYLGIDLDLFGTRAIHGPTTQARSTSKTQGQSPKA